MSDSSPRAVLQRVCSDFPLAYFQRADADGVFPEAFFSALAHARLLTYDLSRSGNTVAEFATLASAIGESSIAASICWVMHNQQYDCLVRAGKQHLVEDSDLLASVTTQPEASAVLTRTKYPLRPREDGGYQFLREAPIVSFGHLAKYFIATLNRSPESDEVWLCLLDRSHVRDITQSSSRAEACRSTQNQSMVFEGVLSPDRLLMPLRDVLQSSFGPLAHIGWASAYHGGVMGVLQRLRQQLRGQQSFRGRPWDHGVLVQRLGAIVGRMDGCAAFIRLCALQMDQRQALRFGRQMNSLKLFCSTQLSQVVDELKVELGMVYAVTQNDPLGFEILRRDIDCARLMFHNDKIAEYVYNDWFLRGERH